jgi:uncharacterized protein YjbJ (UPF0337 family)
MEDTMNPGNTQPMGQRQGSSQVGSGLDGVAQQAKTFGRDIKDKTSEFTDSLARTAKSQAQGLSAAAGDLAGQAKDKVEAAVNDKKSVGADYIGNIASAVHRVAGEIGNEIPQAAPYIHQAANRLEGVATAVREKNVRELVAATHAVFRGYLAPWLRSDPLPENDAGWFAGSTHDAFAGDSARHLLGSYYVPLG